MGYVGMDKENREELQVKDFYMPRLEGSNNHYFVTTIQHFIETMKENGFDPYKSMAIMSYVPDKEAYHKAMEAFPNIAAYYPGDHYEKNIFRLHGKEIPMKELINVLDNGEIDVLYDRKKGSWMVKEEIKKNNFSEIEEEEEER